MSVLQRSAPRLLRAAAAAILLSMLAAASSAEDVGTVAAFDPQGEIGRAGAWAPAAIGTVVQLGDTLRTTAGGRLRVVFRDDSVVTLAENTELAVDENVFRPDEGTLQSALRLVNGKIRALVGENYGAAGSSFEVRSTVGTSGVRGTDFVVLYDDRREVMDVVGVSGRVAVSSPLALVGSSVYVTGHEISSVERGKLPTAPTRIDDALFRQYLEGLEFVGAGRAESFALGAPLLRGDVIPAEDAAASVPLGPAARAFSLLPGESAYTTPDVSTLLEQPPLVVDGGPGLGVRF